MTEEVFALNEEAKWEQAIAKFSISYNNSLDINYEGDFWRNLSLTNGSLKWHLQVKVSAKERSDTQKPNCLPEVLGRPFYRVKLNQTTTIKMAVSDADGDTVKCYRAEYVEGGAISTHKTPGVDVLENCQVKIAAHFSHGYTDDTWIAVAVVVRDYNEKSIMYGEERIPPYAYSLGYTSFQFAVNVLEKLSPPQFVSPTPPNGQNFVLYIGVLWTTEIYAEASENATIASFTSTSRRIKCGMSDLKDDPKRGRVKYVTLTWPSVDTTGTQVICITAQDDTGVDSAEDICMHLNVIADTFNHSHNAPSAGKPVFIDIPAPEQIINCPIHTTCFVPLYIKSAFNVTSVQIERYGTYDAKVGSVVKSPLHGIDVYKTDLSFRDTSHGEKLLCFIATNSNGDQSDETCIMSEIEPPNPCVSSPCRNSATCSMDTRSGTFICSCLPNFHGKQCEKKTVLIPCLNGGVLQHSGGCYCLHGFTGPNCETDINFCTTNATCSQHGICKDGTTNYTCECIDRFSDSECQTDNCPDQGSDKASCPVAGCETIDCNNNGLCTAGGVCKCSSGYTGSQCETAKGNMSSINNADVEFVPPTLQAGSTLVCHIEGNSVQPCAVDAFVITRSGDIPSIDLRLSPELDVNSTTQPVALSQDVRGVTGMYYATIIIKGIVASTEGHFACIIASNGTSQVERCYQIKLVQDPQKDPTSLQYAQRNASMYFIDPTPKDGSVILCSKNVSCHLILYTHTKDNTSSCQDMISTTKDVLVFKAHQERTVGTCVAEVTFLLNGNVDREICFQSTLINYQQRCFQIRLYEPNSDPCNSTSCFNGGHCIRTSQDDFTCKCPPNFVGDKCQKGPCKPGENICQNNAYCQKNENSVSCICQLGFTGSMCDKDSGNSTSAPTALFTDTAKPDIFQCVIDQHCSVSLILSSTLPANERPTVAFGYKSPVVDVIQLKTSKLHTNNTELLQTSLILKGRQEGLYKICLQIKNVRGTTTDEMCFKVNVITDVTSINAWLDRPYFLEPSLPTDTTVECAENGVCHVLYQVTSGKGNNDQCISIRPTVSEGSLNFHLFTTCDQCIIGNNDTGNCNIDVSFTTPPANGQKITMCLELSLRRTTTIGEERCFSLSILKTADAHARKGCQQLQCTNGGFCDGRDADHPFCICPKGFAGTTCEKDARNVDPSGISSSNFVGDCAIPEGINCEVGLFCSVPYQVVHKPGENTTLELGYTDRRILVLLNQFNDNSSDGIISLVPKTAGTYKFCQQMMIASLTADEICTTLNVQAVAENIDESRPQFKLPTLRSGSTVMCNVKKSCHLEIHFALSNDSEHNKICPDVISREETTIDKIHFFDVRYTTTKDCSKDVSVIHNTEDVRRLCLQLVLPGKKGEIRCYNIHFVNDMFSEVQHPCRGFTCMNFGKCLAIFRTSTPTASCICQNGFSGDKCQNVVGGNDTLPGVEGITTETASQYFDTLGALPTLLQCKGTDPCCIAVPYYGNKNLPPLIGFLDNGLRVENESVYTPLNTNSRWHVVTRCFTGMPEETKRVCYQTTTDGTNKSVNVDEMCFEVGFKSSGTQPSAKSSTIVDPPDGTHFACLPNKVCHILVRTETKSGGCEEVKQCGQGMPGAHIFDHTLSDGICSTNIAVAIGDDGTTDTMCISSGGDERNLIVESKSPSSMGYGPCQKLHCQHGGVCKAETNFQAVCECPSNYSGDTCEKENIQCNNVVCLNGGSCKKTNGTQPVCECPADYTGLQCDTATISHFDDRFALPKVVSCNDEEPCCVSVAYKGSPNFPPVVSGHDLDINITSGPNITDIGKGYTGVYVSRTCVEASVGIQHKLCLKTSSEEEEACFLIDVHHKESQSTSIQPKFVRSLPDGTRVLCKPKAICRLPVTTTTVNGTCETVKPCVVGGIYVASPEKKNGLCETTVVWITGATSHGSLVCLTAGNGGEKRTYIADIVELNFTDHSPCMSKICNHGGKCVLDKTASSQKAVCVCMTGYVGTTCETAVNKTTGLPGVEGVNSTIANQQFVGDLAIPDVVQCDEINQCCLSVPYYGDPHYPPILSHHDSGLDILGPPTISPGLGQGSGGKESLSAVTCVSGTPGTPHRICFQTTTNGTKQGMNIDELCFKVQVNPGGNPNPVNIPQFDKSSLQNGTTVICPPNTNCHIPITTMPYNGACQQVKLCDTAHDDVQVLNTNLVGGKCLTDVAYNTVSNGSTNVCFSAGENGEKRTLQVETKDMTSTGFGPCQKLHCENGGKCLFESSTQAKCVCTDGFSGQTCETSLCDGLNCTNGGKCVADISTSTPKGVCSCPSNFVGDFCQKNAPKSTVLPGVDNVPDGVDVSQHFVGNAAVPTDVQCDIVNHCCLSVPYNGIASLPPILGHHDSSLTVTSHQSIPSTSGSSDSHISVTCVNGTIGSHKLCLQTTTNGTRDGMNIDEICVNFQINAGGHNTTKNGPHFDGSTLTNGTHVVCMPTSECHLPVITAKHNGLCPQVDLCEPFESRIHVFDTTPVGDKCITDVAMKTGAAETMPVCISAGLSGEERHLLFETKNTSNKGFGSCQKLHCKNGGSCDHVASDKAVCQCRNGFIGNDCDRHACDGITCMNDGICIVDDTGSSTKGVCMCPGGFSGDKCNTRGTNNSMIPGVINMPNHTTVQQHFDGNNAIPKGIVCDMNHECCIPVQYTGEALLPPILGYHDTDLAITSGPRTVVSNAGIHIAVTCVKGTPGMKQRFCLQTTTDGTIQGMNVDEICVEVDTQSGGVQNTLEPHFANSLPNGTHVVCKPDSQCHIPFVTSTNTNSCDQVSSCGTDGDGTHVFQTKLVNGTCITDVAIKTGSTGSTKQAACISAGPNGEQRILLVDIKDPSADGFGGPCQKLHCRNGGSCKSTTDTTAACDCPVGYGEEDCGKNVCENLVCNNGGRCVVNTKGSTVQGECLCTGGFSGTKCDTQSQTLIIPGVQGLPPNVTTQQTFLGNNAVPKDMHCDDNRNCCFPIQYTGDKDRPPILGHYDNDLTVISGPQTVVTNAGTHVAVTCVKGVAGKTQRLCLQTTTNGTKQGMNVDEICVKIETGSGGTTAPMESNFANSLPNGTSVVCKSDSHCHIPVITIAKANTCEQVNNCGSARDGVHPFTTQLVNGTCITDVAVITGPAGSTNALCLSSGSSGSTLQLKIDEKNLTDGFGGPCQKLHCRNGGSCLATNESFATCNCPDDYTGKECSHTPCNETACANSGLCVADEVHLNGICICTSDFSGTNCENAVDKTVAFPGTKNLPSGIIPNQQFVGGSAVPKVVTCDGINPCCISIPYYGDKDLPPIVGHKTLDIISGPVSITPDSTKPDAHIATTCVKGHPGVHDKLCLQTTSDGTEGGINMDEICVEVHVQSGAHKPPPVSTDQPHFTTSLPNGSTVVCQPNSVCHIPVTTAQIAGTCMKVTSCNANDRSFHVVNTKSVDDKCVSDVAVTTGADGTGVQLCISAGSSGEQRTLAVEAKDVTSSGFGPCGRKHCLNGGRCKSYTNVEAVCACPAQFTGNDCGSPVQLNTACPSVPCKNGGLCINDGTQNMKCVCAVGFAGSMCDKVEEQLPLPTVTGTTTDNPAGTTYSQTNPAPSYNTNSQPHHHNIPQTFFNSTALPQHIQCAPEKPCCLQVPYHGDKDLPPMFGYHDEDLTVLQDPDVVTIGSGSDSKSHVAEICVKGQPDKVHRLCLQTTTNGTVHGVNLDEICVEIEVKSPVSTTQHQQIAPGPHFKNSLPDGTELICKPNTMCHVPVTTETTDGICEQVTTCVPKQVGVHAFQTQKANDKCITDVVVEAGANGHLTNICLSAGSQGEKLNLAMKATYDNAFGPCRELHCQNAGMCLSVKSGSPAVCKCPPDFTGTECETGPQCSKEDIEHVKTMVVTGHASCSCIVNGKKVKIVKKRPVVKKEKLYSAAGFGAGGMVGSMAIGVVIYIIVNKLKQPPKSFRPRSPGSKVHPAVDRKRKEANMKNMSF